MPNLLLIESPGKLKKLGQILGSGWMIKASMGHVRELTRDGEDALGFDLGLDSITCHYQPRDARSKKVLAELRKAVKKADSVYIATDPDREGETIGWHLQQALKLKNPRRVTYSEITPQAVRAAIAQPHSLDPNLVAAGRARDCLDKLVGYKGSRHVVWPLNTGAKSMGRVQSATLHLLCLREREIQTFIPQDYWSVSVTYQEGFKAFYRRRPTAQRRRSATAKDKTTAAQDAPESDRVTTQAEADRLVAIARTAPHQVISVEGKTTHQSPPPPFITSTLQQAAGSKLRFTPDKTMKVAQSLYEAGHITYMRTDAVTLSAPFQAAVRDYLKQHDPTNVPPQTKRHRSAKGAQAAHEAIRPTDVNRTPQHLPGTVSTDAAQLYELIWNRAVASQCCPARLRKTRLVTQSGEAFWEARGQVVEFAGYTRYWQNLSADAQLPTLQPDQPLQLQQAQAEPKQTQPPPRYTEPKLVQLMERQGIGRPSTYAPTIKTLKQRTYVQLVKGKLQPTDLGLTLDAALEQLLPDLIQPAFTAHMEAELDAIATGQKDWQAYLTGWYYNYFAPALDQARTQLGTGMLRDAIGSHGPPPLPTPNAKPASKGSSSSSPAIADLPPQKSNAPKSQVPCPKCGEVLHKISSRSKKLKAKHFLKCEAPGCGTVMFWNANKQTYERPYAQRALDPEAFTDYPCPSCGALLVRHTYQKEGKSKVMLRCSLLENRRGKCRDVAFFESRGSFWSPKFGTLEIPSK
ncbi:MAG: type I DNA topoisomerase [Cyanobacteria bacterium J06639_14]